MKRPWRALLLAAVASLLLARSGAEGDPDAVVKLAHSSVDDLIRHDRGGRLRRSMRR
jgi:hypothetical protein